MSPASKKPMVLVLLLVAAGIYVAVRLSGEAPPGTDGEPPGVLERLLPPLPVPEPKVDLSERNTRKAPDGDDGMGEGPGASSSYAAALTAAAEAMLGPLNGGGGTTELGAIKARAASDSSAAGRAARQACQRLEEVARRRTSAEAGVAKLETRTFNTFDDDGENSAKKKAFFQAQARRQWDEYAGQMRPRINRALAAVRAAEQ